MRAIQEARQWGVVTLWILIGSTWALADGRGQTMLDTTQLRPSPPEATVEAAVGLLEQGQVRDAIPVLRHLVDRNPGYVSPRAGAAAYWLGRAYDRAGKQDKARHAWARGLKALHRADRFEVRLADAFLQSQTPASFQAHRDVVREAYWGLLGRINSSASSAEQIVFRRYVAQLAPLLPEKTLQRVVHQPRTREPAQWTFRDEAGTALHVWWRRQDVYPSTRQNERLDEHLARLVKAQNAYTCTSRVSGLDDRGHVFVQLGTPLEKHSVTYGEGDFFQEVIRFGVGVSRSDFPDNEFWSYSHIDRAGYYLFAKSRRCYTIAEANDLLPKQLRQRRSASERGLNIAYSSLMAMRHIYRNLALYHSDFSVRFAEIAKYADWQETQGAIAEARERTGGGQTGGYTVGAGRGQRQVFASKQFSIAPPNRFVTQMVEQARREDQAAAKRRARTMPRQYTELREQTETLPIAVRTARFLTPNGTTRTDVYWGLRTKHLQPEAEAFSGAVISLNGVRYDDATYERRKNIQRQYVIQTQTVRDEHLLHPAPVSIPGTTEPYHLALQWLQFDADVSASGRVNLGEVRREAVVWSDSLRPLRADGRELEMSDVQVRMLDTPDAAPAQWMEASKPYPFRTISASAPLLLYFELYHLTFGSNDRTRYNIAYVVESKTQHGWTRLFRDRQTEQVSMSATHSGTSRRTEELITLDLSSIAGEQARAVRVTVRVTDEVAQTQVERSVNFMIPENK